MGQLHSPIRGQLIKLLILAPAVVVAAFDSYIPKRLSSVPWVENAILIGAMALWTAVAIGPGGRLIDWLLGREWRKRGNSPHRRLFSMRNHRSRIN